MHSSLGLRAGQSSTWKMLSENWLIFQTGLKADLLKIEEMSAASFL